jgi:hypothetical protein
LESHAKEEEKENNKINIVVLFAYANALANLLGLFPVIPQYASVRLAQSREG